MFTQLRLKNFKGWKDTEPIRFAPMTVFFGANSSGKTSLLQAILLLKQTAESSDRTRALHPGDDHSLVDLGTVTDLIWNHDLSRTLAFDMEWTRDSSQAIPSLAEVDRIRFEASFRALEGRAIVQHFEYQTTLAVAGMTRRDDGAYDLVTRPALARRRGRPWPLPSPTRFYGFPDETLTYFQDTNWLADLTFALEQQLSLVHYVGPLREIPKRLYPWAGDEPADVGVAGRDTVAALLAARSRSRDIGRGQGTGKRYESFDEVIARWLKTMGLIASFAVRPIAEGRREYEVKVRRTPDSAEVFVTDVGFGVSQVLPVLVQAYYATPGTTVVFEQPEIHLHPRVQADLADVLIDAAKWGGVQFIIESHSEHFLRRLQRRIAEEVVTAEDVALHVCDVRQGHSTIDALAVDQYGNITNWPKDFFGDEIGDLAAMTEAALRRRHSL